MYDMRCRLGRSHAWCNEAKCGFPELKELRSNISRVVTSNLTGLNTSCPSLVGFFARIFF